MRALASVLPMPSNRADGSNGETEPAQPVREGPHQDAQADERQQVHLGTAGQARATTAEPDVAEDVVDERRDEHREHDDREQVRRDELQPREVEDEEPDVLAEMRVTDAEASTVAPQLEGIPAARRHRSGEQGQDQPKHGDHRPCDRHEAHPVAERGIVPTRRQHLGPQAPRQEGVGQDQRGEEQPHDDEQAHLGEQDGGEDAAVPDRPVPQPISPNVREDRAEEQEGRERDQGRDEDAASAIEYRSARRHRLAGGCRRCQSRCEPSPHADMLALSPSDPSPMPRVR